MSKFFILNTLALFLFQASVYGQRSCGTMQVEAYLETQNPKRKAEREAYEKTLSHWIAQNVNQKTPSVITIPVVVHVVYKNATENISDAQIQSQIDVLNEDFRRLNADAANTPAPFAALAADCEIEFCLAQRDPNGNPTNGIVRVQTTQPEFNAPGFQGINNNEQIKSTAQGGSDAWDVTKYFNFWACKLGGGVLGYAEFPTGSLSNTFGQVTTYDSFGKIGTLNPPYDKGRTSTHEVGHCFNLKHIWGDDCDGPYGSCNGQCNSATECTGSDLVGDTPNACEPNFSCPSYPKLSGCSPSAPGEMFMNYMDYVDDNCMNMFSQDQKTRMLAVLNTAPWNVLQNSNGCVPIIAVPNDAGVTAVNSPSGTICATNLTPAVTLKNFGASLLTSVTIKYSVDAGTPASYAWTGSLAANATVSVTLPSITSSAGAHTFEAYTENPNGSVDGDASNDQSTSNFTIGTSSGVSLPLVEGFEGATFPPATWTINNPDNLTSWARTTQAAKTGSASMYMNNFDYGSTGKRDEFISPIFSAGSSDMLTFDLAYSLYTDPNFNPNFSDTLEIYYSSDCGSTWTQAYKKHGAALTTKIPSNQTSAFIPISSQWRSESINLSLFSGSGGTGMLKFVSITGFENNLYIDNINISGLVSNPSRGIKNAIAIFPNPTTGLISVSGIDIDHVSVFDLIGKEISLNTNIQDNIHEISLESQAPGVYFFKVKLKDQSIETYKILKQ